MRRLRQTGRLGLAVGHGRPWGGRVVGRPGGVGGAADRGPARSPPVVYNAGPYGRTRGPEEPYTRRWRPSEGGLCLRIDRERQGIAHSSMGLCDGSGTETGCYEASGRVLGGPIQHGAVQAAIFESQNRLPKKPKGDVTDATSILFYSLWRHKTDSTKNQRVTSRMLRPFFLQSMASQNRLPKNQWVTSRMLRPFFLQSMATALDKLAQKNQSARPRGLTRKGRFRVCGTVWRCPGWVSSTPESLLSSLFPKPKTGFLKVLQAVSQSGSPAALRSPCKSTGGEAAV